MKLLPTLKSVLWRLRRLARTLQSESGRRVWRLLLLFFCSQVLLKTSFWKHVIGAVRQLKGAKSKELPSVPLARPPEFPFLGQFLGHIADIRPWKSTSLVIDLFNKRMQWYDETEGNPKSILLRFVSEPTVFTYDIDFVRAICGKEDSLFRNSDTLRRGWGPLFPNSMTIETGEKWKRVRRIFVSAMSKLDFESLPPSTNEVLERGFSSYSNQDVQEVRLWDLIPKIAF